MTADPSRRRSPRRGLSPLGSLFGAGGRRWSAAERREIVDELFFEDERRIPYLRRFSALIVFSAAIAAFGLLSDSAAVVIGAMLVAPLMTPILAAAAALVGGEAVRLATSLAIILAGAASAIGVAWLVSLASLGALTAKELTGEVLARTEPGLLDLGIAVAAGAAAAFILTDRGASSALPGVAIAVALVPPLAAVGVTAEQGEATKAEGALLLFSTNLVAIVLSAAAVFLATGFVDSQVASFRRHRVTSGLAVTVCAVVAVAVPLALHTRNVVQDQQFESAVVEAVGQWDPEAEIVELKTKREGRNATIDLVVASPVEPEPAWRLAELVSEREGLSDVQVTLTHRSELEDAARVSR